MFSEQQDQQKEMSPEEQSYFQRVKIEQFLTDKHMLNDERKEQLSEYLRNEFQFFRDISNIGVNMKAMIEHLTFMRSLEVKTLCQEGDFTNTEGIYIVFSGQCEVYKTRKDFLPGGEGITDGDEILELDSSLP